MPQSYLNENFGPEPPGRATSPNPWQVISSVVAALAAVSSVVVQWKGNRVFASILVAVALIAAVSILYQPVAAYSRAYMLRLRRNLVARRSWPELLRIEKRFGGFLNQNDSTNLRGLISEVCNRNADEVAKLCPPDYLDDYYGLLRTRHVKKAERTGASFRLALSEIHQMVCSYNQDYVLTPMSRLKVSPVVGQLQPHAREHYEERMKQSREHWVRFLGDFKEFIDKTNHDLRYDDPREAIGTYFEHPKAL